LHIHKELKKSTFIFKSINIHDPNERIFSGWGSVEIIDRQGDIIPIKEFEPVMKILMRRGAPIVDSHSNHKVGEIISYKFRDNEKGERGLYLTAKIYKDYPTDNEVWEGIKNGDYAGFSLGGKAGEKIPICNREGCYNVVKDIEVWEFSVVEKPANQKSLIDHVNKLAKSDNVIYIVKNGYIIQKPFAGYENFDECVAQNRDKDKAEAYCGTIKYRVEKGRVRISSPADAPRGVKIERGPRGGYYYDSEGQPKQYSQTILKNYARIKTSKLSGQLKNISKQLEENKSSKYQYFDSDKKEYTPERKTLHENIINSFIGKNSKSVGKGKAILIGGPPASGKTTLLKDLNVDFDDYVSINNDEIKEKLPGYNGVNASLYHDESRDILNMLIDKSIGEHRNLIIDGTMRDYEKERKKISTLSKIGYTVRVIGIKANPDTVINRATTRFLEENGRYVPLQHIAKTTPIINDTLPKYRELVNNFELWDSSKFPPTKVV